MSDLAERIETFRTPPHVKMQGLPPVLYLPTSVRQEMIEFASDVYPEVRLGVLLGTEGRVEGYEPATDRGASESNDGDFFLRYLLSYTSRTSVEDRETLQLAWALKWKTPPPLIGVFIITPAMPGRMWDGSTNVSAPIQECSGLFGLEISMQIPEDPSFSCMRYDANHPRPTAVQIVNV